VAAIQNLRVPGACVDAYHGEAMRTERLESGAIDPRRLSNTLGAPRFSPYRTLRPGDISLRSLRSFAAIPVLTFAALREIFALKPRT
jgi:hypothetical protein